MIRSLRYPEAALLCLTALLVALIIGILGGVADSPGWLPEQAARAPMKNPLPSQRAVSPSLESFAATWEAPLFSTDRSPDRATRQVQVTNLAGLTLTGVMIDGDLRVALIKRADGPPLKIHQGQALPNGWTLDSLTATQARFTSDGRVQLLSLQVPRLPPSSTTPPISLPRESVQ